MGNLPTLDLNILSSNLHAQSAGNAVPNGLGTRMYTPKSFWGRVWSVLFSIWGWGAKDPKGTCLQKAAAKTDHLFQENLTRIQEYHRQYTDHVNQTTTFTDDHLGLLRRGITNWNRAVEPILSTTTNEEMKKIARLQHLINLEATLTLPIPMISLNNLSNNLPSDQKLIDWIKQVKNNPDAITIDQLHTLCLGASDDSEELGILEHNLDKLDLPQFKQESWPEHPKGATLHLEIGASRRLYTIPGDDKHLHLVAKNRAQLCIQYAQRSGVEFVEIDPKGRFAKIPKLFPVEKGDSGVVKHFIADQVRTGKSYRNLSVKNGWMLDEKRTEMVTVGTLLVRDSLDHHTFYPGDLRDFAFHASCGDFDLYKKYVDLTGLKDHLLCLDDVFQMGFQPVENRGIAASATLLKCGDDFVKEVAKKFSAFKRSYGEDLDVEKIQRVMQECYRIHGAYGLFAPDYDDAVIAAMRT